MLKNKKISLDEHVELGLELSKIHEKIFQIAPIIWKSSSKKSLINIKVKKLIESLTELKNELEHEMYKDNQNLINPNIYYPKALNSNSSFSK